jgi:hypothetical protein
MSLGTVEHFTLPPTPYVPNNRHPVIIYRDVLPKPYSEESTTAFLEANKWEKKVRLLALLRCVPFCSVTYHIKTIMKRVGERKGSPEPSFSYVFAKATA